MTSDLADLISAIRQFALGRDWEQFNSPKEPRMLALDQSRDNPQTFPLAHR